MTIPVRRVALAPGVDTWFTGRPDDDAEPPVGQAGNLSHRRPHLPARLAADRRDVLAHIDIDSSALVWMDQVHGSEVAVVADDGVSHEEEIAVKRVRVSVNPEPNLNPEITAIDMVGTNPLDVEVTLIDEELVTATWMADVGAFDRYLSWIDPAAELASARWQAESSAPGTAWIVFRDGRGGVAWIQSAVGATGSATMRL